MNHSVQQGFLICNIMPSSPKPPPPPFWLFQQRVFFALIINVILICKTKTSYFVNCRRNHPYNRSTFWQPPMHPLHSPWNKLTFQTENQVYFIYFKIENYFELSILTLYHGYSVKLTLSSDLLCKIARRNTRSVNNHRSR